MKIMAAKKQMLSLLLCTVLHCVFVPLGVAFAAAVDSPATFVELNDAIRNGTSTSNITVSNEGGTRTITLNADVDIGGDFIAINGQSIILDLNGHAISGTGSYLLRVYPGFAVTVRDNSANGDGSIAGNENTSWVILAQGAFNLESGTVRSVKNKGYAVYVYATGSLTTSGTVESAYISIYAGGSVNIEGGTITAASYGVYANGTKSSVTVTGGTVNSDDCAIYSMGGSVTVNDGIVNGARYGVYVRENATFHMDGGTITGGKYGVYIYRGGTHEVSGGQIEGQFGLTIWGYKRTDTGEETYGKTVLNVSGGTITSDYHGISGNARQDGGYKRGSTIINISGGDIRCTKDGVGIYHPQEGELNISGGTISGPTGIEMRGGSLNMEGGSVTGTAESLRGIASGDGNTTTGAGIAVSQHPENYAINVHISGGAITGYTSFYENHFGNIYDRVGPDRKPVNLKITGGQFVSTGDASVISMHNTGFISGGSYSYGVDKDYLGTLTWDEAKAFSPAKEQPIGFTGAFSCIKGKVKSNNLPYHVGYLTGYPTSMITMHVGEKRPPFVPTYKLSKVDIEKVIGNATVNVDANTDPDDLDGHITVTYQKKGDGSFVDTYEESLEPAIASWASGAPTVATVNPIGMDEPGVVTAKSVSPSPVNITATLFNGEQVDFFVTVAPTVTFNMNGHGAQVAPQTVANGDKAVKPADPSETGWTFDGWYEDAALTKKFDFSTAITNDITLHAKWMKHCIVTFNMNGHGAQVASQTVANGGKAARPADPVAGGYAFSGWYKDAALTTAFDFGTVIHADMTLYAKWANIPQTGDNTPLFLWIALLIVSCGGIAGTLAFHKEKNH